MAGSLDGCTPLVLGPGDYEYVVISRDGKAEVWLTSGEGMSAADIAAELRRVADFVEARPQ